MYIYNNNDILAAHPTTALQQRVIRCRPRQQDLLRVLQLLHYLPFILQQHQRVRDMSAGYLAVLRSSRFSTLKTTYKNKL
jgi:hypothetical protein